MTPEPSAAPAADKPTGKPFPWTCHRCRQKAVRPAVIAHRSNILFEGQKHVVDVPQLTVPRCEACGELVFDSHAEEQIDRVFRSQVGLLTPEQIRANREALGLGRQELAVRLGIAEDLLGRWEEDLLLPSRAADNLLRLYFALPQVRSALADTAQHPELGVCVGF